MLTARAPRADVLRTAREGGGWRPSSARTWALILAPVLVFVTEYPLYLGLTSAAGPRLGYFLGFVVYWVGWCFLFPLWAVGWGGLRAMLAPSRPTGLGPGWLGVLCLGLPLLLAYATAFPRVLPRATPLVVALSLLIALVNATGEEVLWRGLYQYVFPGQRWLGLVWPSLGFGIWHFAPQSIQANPQPGGAWSLVLVAGLIGLGWAWVAHRTGSIRWTVAAHILFDFAGLGALLYLGPLALPWR